MREPWCPICGAASDITEHECPPSTVEVKGLTSSVVKNGPLVPIRVRDGVPACPCCDAPMREVVPDGWQCAWYADLTDKVASGLRQWAEAELAKSDGEAQSPR